MLLRRLNCSLASLLIRHNVCGENPLLCLFSLELECCQRVYDLVVDQTFADSWVVLTCANSLIIAIHACVHGLVHAFDILLHLRTVLLCGSRVYVPRIDLT